MKINIRSRMVTVRVHAKSSILLGVALFSGVTCETMAQHFHLNAGAQSQAQSTPLYFQNGGSFGTNSGFVLPLAYATNGTYVGHFQSGALTLAAIGTGFTGAPAPGTQVRVRFLGATGPVGGSFGVWDSDGENEATALTFSIPVGTTTGVNSVLLSENAGQPGADPGGHFHGRHYSATKPGLYAVTLQVYDAAGNGAGGGPIHTASAPLAIYFQAGITIASLFRDDASVTLKFASRSGSSFYVQATGTPENPGSWQDITGPRTGNLLQTVTDSVVSNPARFYRLRVTTP